MTRLKQVREPIRLRPKTAVTFVGSTLRTQASGTTIPVVMPTGLQANDFALVLVVTVDTATIAVPSGWTLLTTMASGSASSLGRIYTRTIAGSGDSGTTVNWTTSNTSESVVAVCGVYRGVGGYSVVPNAYSSTATEALNDRPPRFPSVWAGPQDMVVGFSTLYSYSTLSANACTVTTTPSGWTLRQTGSIANNALVYPRGGALMDVAGPRLPSSETYDTQAASFNGGLILALSPVTPRWADSERVPTTLAGKATVIYGTSSSAYVDRPETNWGYNTMTPWGERAWRAISNGENANSRNMSLPGSRAEDICTAVHGTRSYSTRAVPGHPMAIVRPVTWTGLPAPTTSLFLTDLIGNNIIGMADTTQGRAGMIHAVRAVLRRIRSAVVVNATDASITYTGTWTNAASDGVTNGTAKQTTVPGSKMTYGFTNSLGVNWQIDVVLIGYDNTYLGGTGSTYRVLLDGVEVATGTTHNQMVRTNWNSNTDPAADDYGFVQIAVPVTAGPGAHTLVLEHTGSSGHQLRMDSIQVPSTDPPWIVTNCLGVMPAAAYTTYGFTLEKQNIYRELLRAVCQEFTDGRVILYDPSASGRLSGQSSMFASDMVHQNELLMAHYSHEIIRALSERVA